MVQGPSDAKPPAHTLLRPLLEDSAGRALAARVSRGLDPWAGELWCLSARAAADIMSWLASLVRYWRRTDHRAFAASSAWTEDPLWMTHAEHSSLSAYQARLQEIEIKRAELTAELEGLLEVREDARRQADGHERRLLTCQGPDLVEEVNAALVRLGFEVIDADTLPQHANGRKQEDLRIKDGAWTCLAEVKGYGKGNTKTSDLQQLGKAVRTFVLDEQREPEAQWYIVNQSFRTPPDDRPEPFAGAREDADVFARDNGLVIDTRALFRLDKDVQAGSLSTTDARRILREATGVLRYPASPEEENA